MKNVDKYNQVAGALNLMAAVSLNAEELIRGKI
jgi:hypothetical protein